MTVEKCRHWRKYLGIRFPFCNGGNPCNACLSKWREVNYKLPNYILRPPVLGRNLAYSATMVSYAQAVMNGYWPRPINGSLSAGVP